MKNNRCKLLFNNSFNCKWFSCIAAVLIFLNVNNHFLYASEDVYAFASATQQEHFQKLISELRCLVCQNQSLAESNAPLAADLRNEVYRMVNEGKSDKEIKTYLTKRYGDFVLFLPPLKPATYLLWGAPITLLVLGFFILSRKIKKIII